MIWTDTPGHALYRHHGLLKEDQFRSQLHVEYGGDLEELDQDPAHRHFAGGPAENLLSNRPQGLGEG